MASSVSRLLPALASRGAPANPYQAPSRSSKLKKTLRPCHSPLSDLSALRDLTRNRQGEPLTITSGSEVITSAARGADFDSTVDGRARGVTVGGKVSSSVATARGMFIFITKQMGEIFWGVIIRTFFIAHRSSFIVDCSFVIVEWRFSGNDK